MNKDKKLIPELRFPEFEKDGEWEERTLGEIAENLDSRRQPVTEGQRIKGTVPYYGASGVIDYVKDFLFDENLLCISEDGANLVARTYPIAFGISGKTWVNNHAHVLKFKSPYTQTVVENYLNSISLEDFLTGMAQPKLNRGQLDIIPIPLPELQEQQKIASCLSCLDNIIAAQNQKLDLLKEHKKGLMQNLFPQEGEKVPKYRFPEFLKDGEWVQSKIENYIDLLSGIALKSEELSDNNSGIRILRGINITEGFIRHSKDIDKFFLGNLENIRKYLLAEGDIVIGMDGSKVGKNVAIIKKEDSNSILIQRVAKVRANEKSDVKYLYQHFMSDKFRKYVDKVNTSSGIPHISAQQIKDFIVDFPPKLKEQQTIAACLSSLDDLIAAKTGKVEQLQLHKKALMQRLFPKMND
ncbi:restriction endonuclease subunit S [Chitinophaga sp. Cy-1792]|uniref:restriction endonuclease subunit S n=1 Tax=Chitinophaga sp. Cy-1792 TaxID=2608339 RepID=UPI0014211947|nr:restriction endonuclease subunit S [Chitinophaga sp. Cy-1792]NIG55307.1 hypothetical protein [Chitinophaga sp. Cy-1792]